MNKSFLLALGSLLLSAPAFAQSLDQKLDIDIPAGRISAVLPQLSKAAGVRLEAAAAVSDDVILVSLHGVTLAEAMKKIADADAGEWLKEGEGYRLSRAIGVKTNQENKEVADRAAALSAVMAKLQANLKAQPAWNADTARKLVLQQQKMMEDAMQQMNSGGPIRMSAPPESVNQNPAARAGIQLFSAIKPQTLAAIAPGQRVVFSTNPTRMQLAFNGNAARIFEQFAMENRQYAEAYSANQPPQDQNNQRTFVINGMGPVAQGNGDPKLGLGVGLLIVTRQSDGSLNAQLVAADPKLDTLATGTYSLRLPNPEAPAKPNPAPDEKPIQLSDESKIVAQVFGGRTSGPSGPVRMVTMAFSGNGPTGEVSFEGAPGGAPQINVPKELREKLLHPEQYDPLSFGPTDALLQTASQKHRSMVAVIPDSAFSVISRQTAAGTTTPTTLLALLPSQAGMDVTTDDTWIIATPSMPGTSRFNKVNRAALGAFLRTVEKNGYARLDDLAAFALAQPKAPNYNDIDNIYVRLINASVASRDFAKMTMGLYPMYRFYGSLTPEQRRALGQNQQIALSGLSALQVGLVSDLVYNSPGGPTLQGQQQGPQFNTPGGQMFSATSTVQTGGARPQSVMTLGFGADAKSERTIILPNGLGNAGFLQVNVKNEIGALAYDSKTGAASMVNAATLGFYQNAQTQPELASITGAATFDKFKPATIAQYGFNFTFAPGVTLARTLSDGWTDPNAQATTYAQLPEDFRKQVEQFMNSMKNVGVGGPGGRQSPPPSR